jgi:hypothetical protein
MEKIFCAVCGENGGKLILRGKHYIHDKCTGGVKMRDTAKNLFPLTTMHLSDDPTRGPITVNSLHHLRKLEAEHGVQSYAFNYDHPETREGYER